MTLRASLRAVWSSPSELAFADKIAPACVCVSVCVCVCECVHDLTHTKVRSLC